MTRALEAPRDVLTDAELEPVARALVMLHTPEYADDAEWAEHWEWFVRGMKDSPDLWSGSYQGVALRQARVAIKAWQAARGTCRWTRNDDDGWDTSCGEEWVFWNGGGPKNDGCKFCHGCGKPIEAQP